MDHLTFQRENAVGGCWFIRRVTAAAAWFRAGADTEEESHDGEGPEEIEQGNPQAQGGKAQEECLQPVDERHGRGSQTLRRPLTPPLLGAFFAFATAACALAGTSLLLPGGPLDWIWRLKPAEHRQLLGMGPPVGAGFLLLALLMALAGLGAFARRRWGWRLALAIFAVDAAGDAARIPFGAVAEGLIGIAATGAILWWLTRPGVRVLFQN